MKKLIPVWQLNVSFCIAFVEFAWWEVRKFNVHWLYIIIYIVSFLTVMCVNILVISSICKVIHLVIFCLILLIVVMINCKKRICHCDKRQFSTKGVNNDILFIIYFNSLKQPFSMFQIKWFVNEKVAASKFLLQEFGTCNQHWLQDTVWNNILRNKQAIEHSTCCLINLWNHSIDTWFYWRWQQTQI